MGLVHVKDRHAVDRRRLIGACSRIDNIIGTDHEDHVRGGEFGINLLHLLELLVGHGCLSQKHVHMSRHATRHRMDRVVDLNATGGEEVGQFAQG